MSFLTLRRLLKRWLSGGAHVEPTRCAWPTGHERYGLDEKPEGWNEAVLHHFHSGPELREPSPPFSAAFMEVARREDQRRRTLEWARRFRAFAAELPDEPIEGVHPVIWEALRDSYIAQAEQMEAEARALAYPQRRA